MKHFRYLSYVVRHKWFVFVAGLKLRVPLWQLIIHDHSKFRPDEWFPYAQYFYGKRGPKRGTVYTPWDMTYDGHYEDEEDRFNVAWLKHIHRSPHHWQHWLLRNDAPSKNWVVQAYQPEIGPWDLWSVKDNRHVALFADRDDPLHEKARVAIYEVTGTLNTAPMALPMPMKYVREMVADWVGAGRAMGKNDAKGWYQNNKKDMTLHHDTRLHVEDLLENL